MKYLVAGVKENHRLTVFIEIKKIAASKSTTTSTSTHNYNYNQIYVHSRLKPGVKLFCSDFIDKFLLPFFPWVYDLDWSYTLWPLVGLSIFFFNFVNLQSIGPFYILSQMLMFQSIARLGWSEIDGNMASLFFLSA